MRLKYEELIKHYRFADSSRKRLIKNTFEMVETLIDPSVIDIFYPKNLFKDENILEFIVFLNGKVIVIANELDDVITTEIIKVSDIEVVHYEKSQSMEQPDQLKLSIAHKSEIILNSNADSNEHWKNEYKKSICEIVQLIIADKS